MLINGRTSEEIKQALEWMANGCLTPDMDCEECRYNKLCKEITSVYTPGDALELIEHLESERDAALAKVPKWISVEERLPENDDLVLVRANGRAGEILWEGAYVLASYDSEGWSLWDYEDDDVKYLKILHWSPLPKAPEEETNETTD